MERSPLPTRERSPPLTVATNLCESLIGSVKDVVGESYHTTGSRTSYTIKRPPVVACQVGKCLETRAAAPVHPFWKKYDGANILSCIGISLPSDGLCKGLLENENLVPACHACATDSYALLSNAPHLHQLDKNSRFTLPYAATQYIINLAMKRGEEEGFLWMRLMSMLRSDEVLVVSAAVGIVDRIITDAEDYLHRAHAQNITDWSNRMQDAKKKAFSQHRDLTPDEIESEPVCDMLLGKLAVVAIHKLGGTLTIILQHGITMKAVAEQIASIITCAARHRDTAEQLIVCGVLIQLYQCNSQSSDVAPVIELLETQFKSPSLWQWAIAQLEIEPCKSLILLHDRKWVLLMILRLADNVDEVKRVIKVGLVEELQDLMAAEDRKMRCIASTAIHTFVMKSTCLPVPNSSMKLWRPVERYSPVLKSIFLRNVVIKNISEDGIMENMQISLSSSSSSECTFSKIIECDGTDAAWHEPVMLQTLDDAEQEFTLAVWATAQDTFDIHSQAVSSRRSSWSRLRRSVSKRLQKPKLRAKATVNLSNGNSGAVRDVKFLPKGEGHFLWTANTKVKEYLHPTRSQIMQVESLRNTCTENLGPFSMQKFSIELDREAFAEKLKVLQDESKVVSIFREYRDPGSKFGTKAMPLSDAIIISKQITELIDHFLSNKQLSDTFVSNVTSLFEFMEYLEETIRQAIFSSIISAMTLQPADIPAVLANIMMAAVSFDSSIVHEYLMARLMQDEELGCGSHPINKKVTSSIISYVLMASDPEHLKSQK